MFLDNKVYWLSRNSHQHTTASWFLLRKSAMHCTHVALSHGWQPRDLRMGECICGFPDAFIYSFLRWNKVQGECSVIYSLVQFSCSVVSDSLWPLESQHARPPWTSPTPGVHSDSRPSSQWCHPAISSSVIPFSSCPQSLPASGRSKLLIVLELKFYDDKYLWTLGLFHGQTLPFFVSSDPYKLFPHSLFLCLLVFLVFFFLFIVAISLSFAFKSLWFCPMSWTNKLYTFSDQIIAY